MMPEAGDQRQVLNAFKLHETDANFQSHWNSIRLRPALSHEEQELERLLQAELPRFQAKFPSVFLHVSGTQILDGNGSQVNIFYENDSTRKHWIHQNNGSIGSRFQ